VLLTLVVSSTGATFTNTFKGANANEGILDIRNANIFNGIGGTALERLLQQILLAL
jgi:hypothetical protein